MKFKSVVNCTGQVMSSLSSSHDVYKVHKGELAATSVNKALEEQIIHGARINNVSPSL